MTGLPLQVTSRAWVRLRQIRKQNRSTTYLTLVVRKGGCSGKRVDLVPTSVRDPSDVEIPDPDHTKHEIPYLMVPAKSVFPLFGRTMDFVETKTGAQFTFLHTDPSRPSCGCGESLF